MKRINLSRLSAALETVGKLANQASIRLDPGQYRDQLRAAARESVLAGSLIYLGIAAGMVPRHVDFEPLPPSKPVDCDTLADYIADLDAAKKVQP